MFLIIWKLHFSKMIMIRTIQFIGLIFLLFSTSLSYFAIQIKTEYVKIHQFKTPTLKNKNYNQALQIRIETTGKKNLHFSSSDKRHKHETIHFRTNQLETSKRP